jgi:hypothetical protein
LEAGRGRLRGAFRRPHALDLRGDQGRHEPQQRALRGVVARAHPQLADHGLGDSQLDRRDVVGAAHQRALIGGRASGDGEHGTGPIDQDQTRVERAGGGPEDLGQAGTRLNGVGDRGERPEVRRAGLAPSRSFGHG